MKRRQLLGVLSSTGIIAVTGCIDSLPEPPEETDEQLEPPFGGVDEEIIPPDFFENSIEEIESTEQYSGTYEVIDSLDMDVPDQTISGEDHTLNYDGNNYNIVLQNDDPNSTYFYADERLQRQLYIDSIRVSTQVPNERSTDPIPQGETPQDQLPSSETAGNLDIVEITIDEGNPIYIEEESLPEQNQFLYRISATVDQEEIAENTPAILDPEFEDYEFEEDTYPITVDLTVNNESDLLEYTLDVEGLFEVQYSPNRSSGPVEQPEWLSLI